MARADLLVNLVRAGAKGDQNLFHKCLEAIVVEERAKQHHILADRLAAHLNSSTHSRSNSSNISTHRLESNSNLFVSITPQRWLSDLVLTDSATMDCNEILEEFQRADLLRSFNLEPRHRILLIGPPGNGKTSLAEAVATELAIPLFVVRYESIIASYLGETAVRLSRLFNKIRSHRCVLFFDEFDVIGKERGDVHETGEIKRVVSSLLLHIDDLPSHVVVITATNHPELLDRAVWRRFQITLELPAPTQRMAEKWFHQFQNRFGEHLGFEPENLAEQMKGWSFAELEQFSLEVQRDYVLNLPTGNIKAIVAGRLKRWQERVPQMSV